MIKSVLIANRGEIAVRVIRACKTLGIRAVLACSEADKLSLAATIADQVVCVGPPPALKSYLNQSALISAALLSHCDAIHPGVGFLSENSEFAKNVEDAGLIFIGPPHETIALVGNKIQAKKKAKEQSIPLIPGTEGGVQNVGDAINSANEIGFPVLLKAASGGGGKGIRIVRSPNDIQETFNIASSEAEQAFGDGTLYMEHYIETPRHVEVQLLADTHGNVIHLGVRDCTVQHRHQKLIEESPSVAMSSKQQEQMCADAVRLFASLDYVGAGTIEFLLEDGNYYFMEVNARVQVEHPVSEMCSNVDIVCEQIRCSSGEKLSFAQEDIKFYGHAIECRINAKTPGLVKNYHQPGGYGVRIDSMLYSGYVMQPFYDSLMAKVIVHGASRQKAIATMISVLDELIIDGIQTNVEEQKTILKNPLFQSGKYDTTIYEIIFGGSA